MQQHVLNNQLIWPSALSKILNYQYYTGTYINKSSVYSDSLF